jgi:hypothetical protein
VRKQNKKDNRYERHIKRQAPKELKSPREKNMEEMKKTKQKKRQQQ